MSRTVAKSVPLVTPDKTQLLVVVHSSHTGLLVSTGKSILASVELSDEGRQQLITALLDWKFCRDQMPTEGQSVAIAIHTADGEDHFATAWFEGSQWFFHYAGQRVVGSVYAWAELPIVPPMQGGVS